MGISEPTFLKILHNCLLFHSTCLFSYICNTKLSVSTKLVMLYVTTHLLVSEMITFVDTEIPWFQWSVIPVVHLCLLGQAILQYMYETSVFLLWLCNYSLCLLHSHTIFFTGGEPKCLSAALLSMLFRITLSHWIWNPVYTELSSFLLKIYVH